MTTSVTEEVLQDIEQKCAAATPGPWKSYLEARDGIVGTDFIQTDGEDIYLTGATHADYDFIASSRQDVPMLIAEIRRLRGLLGL